jgi:hypothetical protein
MRGGQFRQRDGQKRLHRKGKGVRPVILNVLIAVESVCGIQSEEFCGRAKGALVVAAREALVLSGRRFGASATDLARLTGLDIARVSRRHDAAIDDQKKIGRFEMLTRK